MTQPCGACGFEGDPSRVLSAREMMFGTREHFTYEECASCKTLHLLDPPSDMGRYYPADDYYSLHVEDPPPAQHRPRYRMLMDLCRRLPSLPDRVYGSGRLPEWTRWFAGLSVGTSTPILDVGSGAGALLHVLAADGFSNVVGVDPHVKASRSFADGSRLIKGELSDEDDHFDVVMFHHSLEHVADPGAALASAHRVLNKGGAVLVRIPVADCYAFTTYGENWVALDAPRHLFLFTTEGFMTLARASGYEVKRIFYDSYALQFWGSELYKLDIPQFGPDPARRQPPQEVAEATFTPKQLQEYERRSQVLNRSRMGDQAGFVLRVAGS